MRYHILTIFPEFFDSFLTASLMGKASEKGLLQFNIINTRDFTTDKHQQVDDEIYGGGPGLLMKAQPIIDAVRETIKNIKSKKIAVIMPTPSQKEFTQSLAHYFAETYTDIIFICGRYEGIDHRVELWCNKEFGQNFYKLSIGKYVTMGGELPAQVMIEAIGRLVPGVIQDAQSRQQESYRPELGGENIEHPQYTRPQEVEGFYVPEVLLSGHHNKIEQRKNVENGCNPNIPIS